MTKSSVDNSNWICPSTHADFELENPWDFKLCFWIRSRGSWKFYLQIICSVLVTRGLKKIYRHLLHYPIWFHSVGNLVSALFRWFIIENRLNTTFFNEFSCLRKTEKINRETKIKKNMKIYERQWSRKDFLLVLSACITMKGISTSVYIQRLKTT